jgi:hypothetical protein
MLSTECVSVGFPWATGRALGRVLESMSVPVAAGGGASPSGTRRATFMCTWMVYPSTHSSWCDWAGSVDPRLYSIRVQLDLCASALTRQHTTHVPCSVKCPPEIGTLVVRRPSQSSGVSCLNFVFGFA